MTSGSVPPPHLPPVGSRRSGFGGSLRRRVQSGWQDPDIRRALQLAGLGLVGLIVGVSCGSWTRACAGAACPSISVLDTYRPAQAAKIYAADGRAITDLGLERRTVLPLS